MSKAFFHGMTKTEREQFWLSLYSKYQKYSGTLAEFLKEHEISASAFAFAFAFAFARWNTNLNPNNKEL
jgi:hypothetical protein